MPFGVARPRQQADQDFRPRQEGVEAGFAVKRLDAGKLFGVRLQPATLKPRRAERAARIAADHAEPHDADRNLARGRLIVRAPEPLALLGVVEPLPPMMHQHVQHDIFGHPHGEVGMRDARHRHRRQRRDRPSR